MAENNSVGVISLDLVIKEKLGAQLEKIKARISSPVSSMKAEIEDGLGEAFENVVDKAENAFDDLDSIINQAVKRYEDSFNMDTEIAPKVVPIDPKSLGFDAGAMEFISEFEQKMSETAETCREKLRESMNAPDAAEPVQEVTERATESVSLLQKKWQELCDAAPQAGERIKSALSSAFSTIRSAGERAFSALRSVGSKAFSTIKSTAKGALRGIRSTGSKALDSLKSKLSGVGSSASAAMKPVAKLGNALKNTFRRVFLMAGIYAAFRAIKDGLIEAAKADEQFASSLNDVKANLAIAFTPILQTIMPALNTLMAGLAVATKQIAGFIAGLLGTTYQQAAEATKKLKGAADAAKKAKSSMAGIDEMNVLSKNEDSSSGSSGTDYSSLDMTEPELPDWAEKLRDSIKAGDWSSIGAELALCINSVFDYVSWDTISDKLNRGIKWLTDGINGFVDNLDWGKIGETLAGGLNTITSAINTFYEGVNWSNLGKGIAAGLNSAISKINWKNLGKALSQRLRAIIDLAYSFVTTFNWTEFGTALSEAVNSWFENIDFGKAGATLSEGIKGALDTAIAFLQNTDWRAIGNKIADFLANIDWAGIASRLFELLGSAIGAAASLLWGLIEDAVGAIGDYFSNEIEECGGNVIAGLLSGILNGIVNIGKWIYNNILLPFVNGFKKAFGIASPSKVMEELGGFLMDGLLEAIVEGILNVISFFSEMLSGIKELFNGIGEWFSEKFSSAWTGIKNAFSAVGDFFGGVWTGITGAFSAVGTFFSDTFSGAWTKITDAFKLENIAMFFGNVWGGIVGIFSNVGTWFSDKFQAAYDTVTGIWTGITDFFSGLWTGITDGVKDGINWVLEKLESGINLIISGLNMISFDLPDVMGGAHVGFNLSSVSLPRLATGGLATAPTLALVGDNRNARTDPEAIAPISKLKELLEEGGGNAEIIELLREILALLRSGLTAELIGQLLSDGDMRRTVLRIVAEDNARRGG